MSLDGLGLCCNYSDVWVQGQSKKDLSVAKGEENKPKVLYV